MPSNRSKQAAQKHVDEVMELVNEVQKNRVYAELSPSNKDKYNYLADKAFVAISKKLMAMQFVEQPQDTVDLYYLQDARHSSMVGNCPSWWRPDSCSYTTNLDEAARFTLEEALAIHRRRGTDVPWLCSEIDLLRRATIDHQYMPRSMEEQKKILAKG